MHRSLTQAAFAFIISCFLCLLPLVGAASDYTDPNNTLYPGLSLPAWSNNEAWYEEMYWATIRYGDLDGDGTDELVGCGPDGLEIWSYDSASGVWNMQDLLKELAHDSDGGMYAQPDWYNSLVLADIDGDGAKEILGRNTNSPDLMFFYDYNSPATSQSDKWGLGPNWNLVSGWDWDQAWCYETIMAAKLDPDDAREAIVVYTTDGLQAAYYDAQTGNPQKWIFSQKDSLTALKNLNGNESEPSSSFYKSLQSVQMDLTGKDDSDLDEIIFVALDENSSPYVCIRRYEDGKWVYGRMDHGTWRDHGIFQTLQKATYNSSSHHTDLQYDYGDTLQVADLNGDGLKEVLFFGPEGLHAYYFESTVIYTKQAFGWAPYGNYSNFSSLKTWDQIYQDGVRLADIDHDGKDELFAFDANGGWFYRLNKQGSASVIAFGAELSQDNGWDDSNDHYVETISFPTLKTDGTQYMMVRGSSGMRTYKYTASHDSTHNIAHLVDAAKGNFITYTGEQATAYQAILEYFWQKVPSMKGRDLRDTYAVNLDGRQWSVTGFTSLDGATCPAGVSDEAWQEVKAQIEMEIQAVPRIYQLYSSYLDHIMNLKSKSEDALDQANSVMKYSGKKTDKSNFWVGFVIQTCVNVGIDVVSLIPGLEELWLLKSALPVSKDLFGAGFSALWPNDQGSSKGDQAVELAYGDFKNSLSQWFTDNLTQLTIQLTDVLTSWGKLQHVNNFALGIEKAEANDPTWQWTNELKKLAVEQAAAYKHGVYQYLIPLEYEIWWYHDKENPWWKLTFWSDPPSYSYYYDSSLNQHWALVYKDKHEALGRGKPVPKELMTEALNGNLSDSDLEKQYLFLGTHGWDIDTYIMPE